MKSLKLSKIEQVYRKLFQAGDDGVFSLDLLRVGGVRYAARVNDLRELGHQIVSIPERRGTITGVRYILRSEGIM